jgi:hypothetical protein
MTSSDTSRFDPTPDEPYGKCMDCGAALTTEADSRAHMSSTFKQSTSQSSSSHRVRITNPSRPERIRREMARIVDDALYDAMEALDRLTGRAELTDNEVAEALRMWPDFADAWDEHVREGE